MTTFLILLTWIAWVFALTGLGSSLLGFRNSDMSLRHQFQAGLWLGLGLALLGLSTIQIFIGVGQVPGAFASMTVVIVGNALLARQIFLKRNTIRHSVTRSLTLRRSGTLLALLLLGLGIVEMAYLATGEPMDADAGSYRIGSILYAADYPVIPGLANLHFRFGFNSTLWPFSAFIGTGFWNDEGYRLVTGVFLTALFLDICLRIAVPRPKGPLPGDWFLIIAIGFIGAIIFTDVGRWIPSPAQDIVFYVLISASTAFLIDFLRDPAARKWQAQFAMVVAALAGSVRPLGWFFLVLTVSTVVLAFLIRRAPLQSTLRLLRLPAIFSGFLILIAAARDFLLSGWLLYPLRILSFPVPWRTLPGEGAQAGITAYGRAPGVDMNEVLSNSDWFIPWLQSALSSREVSLLRYVVLGALIPILWPSGRRAWKAIAIPLALALIPSIGTTAIWFISAPDLRFGWGVILGVCAIPGALLISAQAYPLWLAKILGIAALAGFMTTQILNGRYEVRGNEPAPAIKHIGPVDITVYLGVPPTPGVQLGTLGDGTPVKFPDFGGNCYDIFPLCLLPDTGSNVRSLGNRVEDGFAIID